MIERDRPGLQHRPLVGAAHKDIIGARRQRILHRQPAASAQQIDFDQVGRAAEQAAAFVEVFLTPRPAFVPGREDLDGRDEPSADRIANFDPSMGGAFFHDRLQYERRDDQGLTDGFSRWRRDACHTDVRIRRLNGDAAFIHHVKAFLGHPTPAWVTEALLAREHFGGSVWEPACGSGAMSEILRQAGYEVRSSDLIDRGYGDVENFLQSDHMAESIVTNPPFNFAEEFVKKALTQTKYKVAFFLPLTFLEGERRHTLLAESPLRTVHVFSRRVSLYREGVENRGNGRAAYAWYVWEHGYGGPPTLGWITR
jgi:hypothetical protein